MDLFPGGLLAQSSAPRERKYPVVPPEEQESIIRQALGGLMTGLQWVGEGLDKSLGGRSVRALGFDEAGNADLGNASLSDLAHLIPFSDTLGLTDQGLFGNRLLADKDAVADPTEIRRNYISEDVAPTGNPYLDFVPNLAMDVGVGMALDPATVIVGPGKALSQKGIEAANAGMRAAKAGSTFMEAVDVAKNSRLLGTSPTAIVNEIKAGERGLIGLKLPFMEHPIATLGAGSQTAAKIADMAYYNPLSAGIRQVFDTRVRGTFSPAAQRQADILFSTNENTAARIIQTNLEVERRMGELVPEYDHLVKDWMEQRPDVFGKLSGDLTDPAFMAQMDSDQMVRAIGELKGGQGKLTVMQDLVKQADAAANVKTPDAVMESLAKFDEVASVAREVQDNAYNLYKGLGGEVKHLEDDFVEHFHRRISTELSDLMPANRQAMKAADGVAGAIHRAIRDVPGGTFKINAMTRDPSITGIGKPTTDMLLDNIQATNGVQRDVAETMLLNMDEKDVSKLAKSIQDARLQANASKLEQTYGIQRKPVLDANGVQAVDPKTGLPVFEEIPLETARWLASLPPAVLEKGLFGRSFVTDMTAYATSMMRRANGLNAVHNLFAEVATDDPDTIGRSVAEIYGQAGNNRRWRDAQGKWHASKDRGLLNLTPEGTGTFASRYAAKKGLNAADVDANNLVVPESMVNAAERMMHYNTNPGDATGLLGAYDSIMRIYKNSIYTPWPASHVRNGISGLWQNMVTAFKNPGSGIKAMNEAKNALMGKGNKQYVQEFKAYGLISGGMLNDVERYAATEIPSFGTLGQAAKDYTLGSVDNLFHPWQTIKGTKRPGPVLAGQKIGEVVEFVNRYSHFSALRERGWSPAAAARSVKLSHFDYGDLSAPERIFFKRLFPFYCVPEHSEALTRDGWKTWQQIEFGEELLTYNVEKDCLEWQPCLEVAAFPHHEDLMVLENTRHRLEFTPEHRWAVRKSAAKISHPYGDYEYPEQRKVVTGEELKTNMSIIVTAEFKDNSESLLTPDQARLLGWLVTDGYHRHRGNHTEAMIYQHPKKFLEEVLRVAGGNPRNPHPDTGVICVPVLNERTKEIKQYLDNDKLISVVTRLSRDAAEAMYDAMYKADGTTSPKRPNDHFAATKPGVLEAFRVLATMLGKRASGVPSGSYVSHNRYLKIAHCTKKMERYDGIVWCPRTENGTWVMRQNGMITITGNTFARKNLPAQLRALIDEPGGRTAQTIRAYNIGRDQSREKQSYVPSMLGEGLTIPIGQQQGDTQNFFVSRGLLPVEEAFNRFPMMSQSIAGLTDEAMLPDPKYTAENIGAMTTLAPLGQYMSGRQWWSHRKLGDLYQEPTGNDAVNFMLYNGLPTSRLMSQVRQLTDERKSAWQRAMNALVGGTRITSVDMPRSRNIEARELLSRHLEPMAGIREGSYLFAPDISKLDEDTIEQLSTLQQIMAQQTKLNKERQKAGR